MAKIIKLTKEHIDALRKDFEDTLTSSKLSDGKINFTKTFGTVKREATVFFTELAWLKMQTLIREFDKEVAWHGIAKRGDNAEKDEYYISDILVYPQEVTGATVNTDQEKYQMWLMSHDDEVFNNIRMQGHSHVNMATSPSAVDTNLYDRILDQLDDDMFYIFMIWNKRGEKTIKIYDLAKNVLFETADCTVTILDDGTGIESFLKESKAMVKDKVIAPVKTYSGYGNYGSASYYSGYNYSSGASSKPAGTVSKPDAKDKKMGKRKGVKSKVGFNNKSSQTTNLSIYDDDDDDDRFSPYYSGWGSEYGC